jgi:ribosomal protein S20
MANEQQPVVMNVSNEILQGFVRAAVMDALPPQVRTQIVEQIVKQALFTKADSYGSRTLFEKAVGEALLEEAKAQCKEYLDEMRPVIAKRIREEIKRANYAERVVGCLMKSLDVVNFRISIGGE